MFSIVVVVFVLFVLFLLLFVVIVVVVVFVGGLNEARKRNHSMRRGST